MADDVLDNWQVQVRKGLLELCVLNALREGRQYGYDIVKQLRTLDGLVIGEGTIYPILSRFRKQGLVESTIEESPDGPARKYYRLTAARTQGGHANERGLGQNRSGDAHLAEGKDMIELTPAAQSRLDDYFQELRRVLSQSPSVDAADVERDIRDHIDAALVGHSATVEASALDEVLRKLGSPAQWLPDGEPARFRKSPAELLSPFNEAIFEVGRRLAGGPERYRLAYLSLFLFAAALWIFPSADIHRGLGILPLVFMFISFILRGRPWPCSALHG